MLRTVIYFFQTGKVRFDRVNFGSDRRDRKGTVNVRNFISVHLRGKTGSQNIASGDYAFLLADRNLNVKIISLARFGLGDGILGLIYLRLATRILRSLIQRGQGNGLAGNGISAVRKVDNVATDRVRATGNSIITDGRSDLGSRKQRNIKAIAFKRLDVGRIGQRHDAFVKSARLARDGYFYQSRINMDVRVDFFYGIVSGRFGSRNTDHIIAGHDRRSGVQFRTGNEVPLAFLFIVLLIGIIPSHDRNRVAGVSIFDVMVADRFRSLFQHVDFLQTYRFFVVNEEIIPNDTIIIDVLIRIVATDRDGSGFSADQSQLIFVDETDGYFRLLALDVAFVFDEVRDAPVVFTGRGQIEAESIFSFRCADDGIGNGKEGLVKSVVFIARVFPSDLHCAVILTDRSFAEHGLVIHADTLDGKHRGVVFGNKQQRVDTDVTSNLISNEHFVSDIVIVDITSGFARYVHGKFKPGRINTRKNERILFRTVTADNLDTER